MVEPAYTKMAMHGMDEIVAGSGQEEERLM
jgi:hypothetical protein